MNRAHLAYFAQDLIGDALVWVNQACMLDTILVKRWQRLCETTIFCTKGVAELFRCFTLFQRVVEYDPAVPWSDDEARGFGHFDLVANSRYDADSAARVEALDHDEVCGFENIDIPEAVCKRIYDRYVPLSRWNDFHLRRETSVTEQGAELIRLYDPEFHEDYIEIGPSEFVREAPEATDRPRIVFVLGASDKAKSWGLKNFLKLARFAGVRGYAPLFLLGPMERDLEPVVREAGFDVGVCLSFRKIAGLFDPEYGTACVVGNDTGLMHLACMLGAPSVTVMPHGTHFTWFPYAADARARHVCLAPGCAMPNCVASCVHVAECAGLISVAQVERAVGVVLPAQNKREIHAQ